MTTSVAKEVQEFVSKRGCDGGVPSFPITIVQAQYIVDIVRYHCIDLIEDSVERQDAINKIMGMC